MSTELFPIGSMCVITTSYNKVVNSEMREWMPPDVLWRNASSMHTTSPDKMSRHWLIRICFKYMFIHGTTFSLEHFLVVTIAISSISWSWIVIAVITPTIFSEAIWSCVCIMSTMCIIGWYRGTGRGTRDRYEIVRSISTHHKKTKKI